VIKMAKPIMMICLATGKIGIIKEIQRIEMKDSPFVDVIYYEAFGLKNKLFKKIGVMKNVPRSAIDRVRICSNLPYDVQYIFAGENGDVGFMGDVQQMLVEDFRKMEIEKKAMELRLKQKELDIERLDRGLKEKAKDIKEISDTLTKTEVKRKDFRVPSFEEY